MLGPCARFVLFLTGYLSPWKMNREGVDARTLVKVRVLVFGAGVIGQIYAARFAEAGHDVCVLGRGATATALAQGGISLESRQGPRNVRVPVVEQIDPTVTWDLTLVTVRLDQLDPVLPVLAELRSTQVVHKMRTDHARQQANVKAGR